MKVILNQDIKGTGKKGDIVEVAQGYANNFLIKKGLASVANSENINKKISQEKSQEHHKQLELEHAQQLADKINNKSVEFKVKSGKNGKLFGSVTAKEISNEIKNKYNIEIDKRKLSLDFDIKSFGTYNAKIKLHNKVEANVKVIVKEEM